jgi:cardiolipin synthase
MALRDVLKRAFARVGLPAFVAGNRVEVLFDGGPFYRRFLEAIESAERYVFLESYIVVADATGWRVAKALAERAKAGVEVAFIVDAYGSLTLDPAYLTFLREAGVKVMNFRPILRSTQRLPFWRKRNHRKLLVADGHVGIVGGMNISDDYAAIEDGGRGWHDCAVRIEGPAVATLEAMFRRLWSESKGEPILSGFREGPTYPEGDRVRFVANFARRERAFVRRAYLLAFISAEQTIRIMNAYFVPDRVLLRALIRAVKRGVKVEVIVGAATDIKSVFLATRSLYSKMLKNGIDVYEWEERVLHAKIAVVDGAWCTIGSSNLDYFSSFRNLEVNAGILSDRIGGELDDQFDIDRARSRRIDYAEWKKRPVWMKIVEWFFGFLRVLF